MQVTITLDKEQAEALKHYAEEWSLPKKETAHKLFSKGLAKKQAEDKWRSKSGSPKKKAKKKAAKKAPAKKSRKTAPRAKKSAKAPKSNFRVKDIQDLAESGMPPAKIARIARISEDEVKELIGS